MELSTIRKAVEDLQRRGEPVSVRRIHRQTGGSFRDILTMLKIVNVSREMKMNGHGTAALSIQDQEPEPAPDRGQLALADLVIADAQDAAAAIWHTLRERERELKAAQSGTAQAEVDGDVEALTAHLARVTALDLIIDRLRLQVTAAEDEVRKRQAARDQLLKRSREIPEVIERLRQKWENPAGISRDLAKLKAQVHALEAEREADAKRIDMLAAERLKLVGDRK